MRLDLVTVGRKWATSPTMKERVSKARVATWLFSTWLHLATWLFSSTEDSMSLTDSASSDKMMGSQFGKK